MAEQPIILVGIIHRSIIIVKEVGGNGIIRSGRGRRNGRIDRDRESPLLHVYPLAVCGYGKGIAAVTALKGIMHRAAARSVCIGHVRCGKRKHILLTVAQHKPLSVALKGKLGIKLECIDIALRAPGDDNILLDRLAAESILKRRTVKNAAIAYFIFAANSADDLSALTHILLVLLLANLGYLLLGRVGILVDKFTDRQRSAARLARCLGQLVLLRLAGIIRAALGIKAAEHYLAPGGTTRLCRGSRSYIGIGSCGIDILYCIGAFCGICSRVNCGGIGVILSSCKIVV